MKVKNDRLIHIKNDRTLFIGRTINREFMVTKMTPENFEARAREIAEANMVETANGMMVVNEWHVLIAETATALCEAYQSGKSAQGIPSEEEERKAKHDHYGSIWNGQSSPSYGEGWEGASAYFRAQAKPVKELDLDIEKLMMPSDDEKETGWREWCGMNIRSMETCQKKDFYGGIKFFINHLHKIKERLGGRV